MKSLLFSILLLTVTNIALSQISVKAFDSAVNYVNCKAVELSLESAPKDSGIIKNFQNQCNCSSFPTYQLIKAAIPANAAATVALCSEIESVKTKFKGSLTPDAAIRLLTDSIFHSAAWPKLSGFADRRKGNQKYNLFIQDLMTRLNPLLSPSGLTINNPPPKPIHTPTGTDSLAAQLQRLQLAFDQHPWESSIPIIALIIAIAALLPGIFILVLILQNRRDKTPSDNIRKYIQDKITQLRGELSDKQPTPRSAVSDKELRDLREDVKLLRTELAKLANQLDNIRIPFEIKPSKVDPDPVLVEQATPPEPVNTMPAPEVRYLSTPNPDGSFNESSAHSAYREGASIYKFTMMTSGRAKFQLDDRESSVRLALKYPEKNIDPVCDALNAFNPRARWITTNDPGEAELTEDKWVVIRKTKIRYGN